MNSDSCTAPEGSAKTRDDIFGVFVGQKFSSYTKKFSTSPKLGEVEPMNKC